MPEIGSTLGHAAARRKQLNNIRSGLMDRPGIARRGGPPPPTAPAQDRTSPREDALAATNVRHPTPEVDEEKAPPTQPQEGDQPPPITFDEETRNELLTQIEPFIVQMKLDKRAKLHRRIGRARKFFGGGV